MKLHSFPPTHFQDDATPTVRISLTINRYVFEKWLAIIVLYLCQKMGQFLLLRVENEALLVFLVSKQFHQKYWLHKKHLNGNSNV